MIVMIEIKDNKILPNMFLILYRNLYLSYICRSLAIFNLFWQLFVGKSFESGQIGFWFELQLVYTANILTPII